MIFVEMPTLPGAKESIVANVLVRPGDVVKAGQELFNVETSKRAVSIKAKVNGIVARVLVSEGNKVTVGDVLAEIDESSVHDYVAEIAAKPASMEDVPEHDGNHAELLVIGGGTGGYVAALYASKKGKRVTLVERDTLGGTCLNRGCIPTKTLISSALLHRNILHAAEWGIEVEGAVHPRMDAVILRKQHVVEKMVQGIEYLMEKNRIRVLRGTASFEGNETVVVDDGRERRLTFDDCIVATGSTIRALALPGADLPEVMNTDEALECTILPKSIVIVGGGVTGMEFAFMYANLGVEVTVIARRDRVLHVFDEAASEAIMKSALDSGINVVLHGDVREFSKQPDGTVRTTLIENGVSRSFVSERVLVTGGRVPMTGDVGIESTDIALDKATGAVKVDDRMRTNVRHVYAIGDVNGLLMLAHAASYQGRLAVDDILGEGDGFARANVPSVAYTYPEVATVGVGIDEARKDESRYTVGTFGFAHNGKALAENGAEGFVSIVADSQGIVKGATIVGSHASELIGYLGVAVRAGMSGEVVRQAVFAHPTTSEAIHEASCDLTFGALHE